MIRGHLCKMLNMRDKAVRALPLEHRKLVASLPVFLFCFLMVYWPFLDTHAFVNTLHPQIPGEWSTC